MRQAAARTGRDRKALGSDAEQAPETSDVEPVRRAVAVPGLVLGESSGARDLPAPGGVPALRRQADRLQTIRRMKVGGTKEPASVHGDTRKKHVMAEAGQAAEAQAGYGSRTFVTSEAALTGVVDADNHDFAAGGGASARFDINAMVPVYVYSKTNAPPAGLAKGQPVSKTVDNVSTNCEIGAIKNGAEKISITHFKAL